MRIKYPARINGRRAEFKYRGVYRTVSGHAKHYNRHYKTVKRSIQHGVPLEYSSNAIYVSAGPFSGQWWRQNVLAKMCDRSLDWLVARRERVDGNWEVDLSPEKEEERQEAANKARANQMGMAHNSRQYAVGQDDKVFHPWKGDKDLADFARLKW